MPVPESKSDFILDRSQEYQDLISMRKRAGGSLFSGLVQWSRPPLGWFKLNCDGSYRGRYEFVTAGGLNRDSLGQFVRCYVAQSPGKSALEAGLSGLGYGLEVAMQLHIDRLEIEMDSKEVVEMLNGEEEVIGRHDGIISRIRTRLQARGWTVVLKFVPRLANNAAGWLSKFSYSCADGFSILVEPPLELKKILDIN